MKLKYSKVEVRSLGLTLTQDMPEEKLRAVVNKFPQLKKFTDEQKESTKKGGDAK